MKNEHTFKKKESTPPHQQMLKTVWTKAEYTVFSHQPENLYYHVQKKKNKIRIMHHNSVPCMYVQAFGHCVSNLILTSMLQILELNCQKIRQLP